MAAAGNPLLEEHEEHENHERWLITYADMITLLMAFFIMLFTMSQLDLAKFKAFSAGVASHLAGETNLATTGGSGVLEGGPAPGIETPEMVNPATAEEAQAVLAQRDRRQRAIADERQTLAELEHRLTESTASAGLAGSVTFEQTARGLVVSIAGDGILFDSGSVDLQPPGRAVLDRLAAALRDLPNEVAVEGHTDDRPIAGRYASNWELSTGRASAVLRYLVDSHALQPARLSASGYADQRPAAPNDTAAGRARNRRVEIIVLSMVDLEGS